jgi:tetratricopeptide (TPR) repeat protein
MFALSHKQSSLSCQSALRINAPIAILTSCIVGILGSCIAAEAFFQFGHSHILQTCDKEEKSSYARAIPYYDIAIRLNPTHFWAHFHRAHAKYGVSDLPGADADYEAAVKLMPRIAAAYRWKAHMQGHFGDVGELRSLKDAIDCNPRDGESWRDLGWWRANHDDKEGAVADLTKGIELSASPSAFDYELRGRLYSDLGEHAKAVDDHNHAIQLRPQYGDGYWLRADARAKLKDWCGALVDYARAIELGSEKSKVYGKIAWIYHWQDRHEEALKEFTKAIELKPNMELYLGRAYTRIELKDHKGAISDLDAHIKFDPKCCGAHEARGKEREALGDVKGAIEDYSSVIAHDPRCQFHCYLYVYRGKARLKLGDEAGAKLDFQSALNINPYSSEASDWLKKLTR